MRRPVPIPTHASTPEDSFPLFQYSRRRLQWLFVTERERHNVCSHIAQKNLSQAIPVREYNHFHGYCQEKNARQAQNFLDTVSSYQCCPVQFQHLPCGERGQRQMGSALLASGLRFNTFCRIIRPYPNSNCPSS